jgi:hypothetical protein
MTLTEFIAEQGLTMTCEPADSNPNMQGDPAWNETASHYACVIHRGKQRYTVPFSMGSAHMAEPTLLDVLECLVSDASGARETFESWCADYGMDTDSRKAERAYRACGKTARNLERLLGPDEYDYLINHVERD